MSDPSSDIRDNGSDDVGGDDSTGAEKPTDQWVTGGEPLTGPQASYLQTLAHQAGEEVPEGLTKAEASEMIERLQQRTGRGTGGSGGGAGTADAGGDVTAAPTDGGTADDPSGMSTELEGGEA